MNPFPGCDQCAVPVNCIEIFSPWLAKEIIKDSYGGFIKREYSLHLLQPEDVLLKTNSFQEKSLDLSRPRCWIDKEFYIQTNFRRLSDQHFYHLVISLSNLWFLFISDILRLGKHQSSQRFGKLSFTQSTTTVWDLDWNDIWLKWKPCFPPTDEQQLTSQQCLFVCLTLCSPVMWRLWQSLPPVNVKLTNQSDNQYRDSKPVSQAITSYLPGLPGKLWGKYKLNWETCETFLRQGSVVVFNIRSRSKVS